MKIRTARKASAAKTIVTKRAKAEAKKAVGQKPASKKAVTFTVHGEKGHAVYVAGEFNEWNPTAKKMAYKARSGIYTATLKLAPGSYQYKFVIDGTWCADPENVNAVANDCGTFNSIVTVA
ncbi:MAG: glycogen-binding domain-containing protein [Kiritimatiellae bacterium]|nr:glycogen-binding domain-containing protein [Kiritimatiellia bacterium]